MHPIKSSAARLSSTHPNIPPTPGVASCWGWGSLAGCSGSIERFGRDITTPPHNWHRHGCYLTALMNHIGIHSPQRNRLTNACAKWLHFGLA